MLATEACQSAFGAIITNAGPAGNEKGPRHIFHMSAAWLQPGSFCTPLTHDSNVTCKRMETSMQL